MISQIDVTTSNVVFTDSLTSLHCNVRFCDPKAPPSYGWGTSDKFRISMHTEERLQCSVELYLHGWECGLMSSPPHGWLSCRIR